MEELNFFAAGNRIIIVILNNLKLKRGKLNDSRQVLELLHKGADYGLHGLFSYVYGQ